MRRLGVRPSTHHIHADKLTKGYVHTQTKETVVLGLCLGLCVDRSQQNQTQSCKKEGFQGNLGSLVDLNLVFAYVQTQRHTPLLPLDRTQMYPWEYVAKQFNTRHDTRKHKRQQQQQQEQNKETSPLSKHTDQSVCSYLGRV